MSAARGGASPVPARVFFSLPERSSELNSRGSLQALFFVPDGLLPSHQPGPPATLSPSLFVAVPRAKPKMAGVAVTVFCRCESLREIPP